jgi:hypothetical protein
LNQFPDFPDVEGSKTARFRIFQIEEVQIQVRLGFYSLEKEPFSFPKRQTRLFRNILSLKNPKPGCSSTASKNEFLKQVVPQHPLTRGPPNFFGKSVKGVELWHNQSSPGKERKPTGASNRKKQDPRAHKPNQMPRRRIWASEEAR